MITLNDYLYRGDTVLKILHNYERDLRCSVSEDAVLCRVDHIHAEYLNGMIEILEHNDFLTSQSQRIREFYSYMAEHYPYLAFTFKGRIKSLIRAEEKFNRHLMELADQEFKEHGTVSLDSDILTGQKILDIRDIIAYRIVISVPKCHLKAGENVSVVEQKALYDIANTLPEFMERFHFKPEISEYARKHPSARICENWRPYYKDFIENPTDTGYRSLHIVFWDELANCRFEIQLRTKEMDDYAEIGFANHAQYEQKQRKEEQSMAVRNMLFYEEARQRLQLLKELDLSKVDVNMFAAKDNILMNDGCGLYRGRLILPYEHLSRFQNDQIG